MNWLRSLMRRLATRPGFSAKTNRKTRRVARCTPHVEVLEDRTVLSNFTVTTTLDSGAGSLRQAILDSNTAGGTNDIQFNIGTGPQSIALGSALPTITSSVTIDGTSEPGYQGTPLIELNGTSAGLGANGLVLTAASSTVQGLAINRFAQFGIVIQSGSGDIIAGNNIGTDVTGTIALGNGTPSPGGGSGGGIEVLSDGNGISSANPQFGGPPIPGNIISGNAGAGIVLDSGANLVTGNLIGVNVNGDAALANSGAGIIVFGPSNTIGGTLPGTRNVISGNKEGVVLDGLHQSANGNIVEGNLIGTDSSGTRAIGNQTGVLIDDNAAGNTVGGTARNLISGNNGDGVEIADANTVFNTVAGNFIGTDVTGTLALPNFNGVELASPNNTIGGTGDQGQGTGPNQGGATGGPNQGGPDRGGPNQGGNGGGLTTATQNIIRTTVCCLTASTLTARHWQAVPPATWSRATSSAPIRPAQRPWPTGTMASRFR
jgi:hypothetical protein